MNNAARAAYGNVAIKAGAPDFGQNGDDFDGALTDAGDAICNMLHALYARALGDGRDVDDVLLALQKGERHFTAEAVAPDDITMSFIDSDNDLSYAQPADKLPPDDSSTTIAQMTTNAIRYYNAERLEREIAFARAALDESDDGTILWLAAVLTEQERRAGAVQP